MSDWTPPAEAVEELARARYERYDSHFSMPGGLSWEGYRADDPEGAEALYLVEAREDLAIAGPVLVAEALAEVEGASLEHSYRLGEARAELTAAREALAAVAALVDEWDADGWRPTTDAGIAMARCGDRLRAVLADHADTLASVRADAWDEGETAAVQWLNHSTTGLDGPKNPYRTTEGTN